MRRISFAAGIAAAVLVLAGCGQNIQIAETGEVTADTPASLAERYVQGLYVRSNVAAGRSVLSQEYPELLYEMELEDKDGNAVVFADLGEDEKREFAEFWEQSTVSELADKLTADSILLEMAVMEVAALDEAVRSATRSGDQVVSAESFTARYKSAFEKEEKKRGADISRSVSKGKDMITKDCLVPSSVAAYKSAYKKGRILVTAGMKSSSSMGLPYVGHASMMSENGWRYEWDTNGLAQTSVSSFPAGKSSNWPGKVDGVQKEPLGLWAGNSGGSATQVSVYDVYKRVWVWDWFRSGFRDRRASDGEYNRAANNALSHRGKPYSWDFAFKWHTSRFYCSQLVWRGWYDVSWRYDTSWCLLWVSPMDIAASSKTKRVASFSNK